MPCHPSFYSRMKRRWHCIQNSNFVFFLFPLSFPSPPPFLPQGLSHLMMSEQGRCVLLVVLQLPKLLAFVSMAGGSDPHHCWQAICCLFCHGPGWRQSHSVVGAPFLMHRGFPPPSPPWLFHSVPFVIRALTLQGCLREGSMKQGMTVSIMGVNEAHCRAAERLTSSCSSPHPMLGLRESGWASP